MCVVGFSFSAQQTKQSHRSQPIFLLESNCCRVLAALIAGDWPWVYAVQFDSKELISCSISESHVPRIRQTWSLITCILSQAHMTYGTCEACKFLGQYQ